MTDHFDPAAIRADALREAAEIVRNSAYTTNGDSRSLEPVSAALRGFDMHHATIADAILATPEALAEAPEVQALIAAAVAKERERWRERCARAVEGFAAFNAEQGGVVGVLIRKGEPE